jgi:hypothetical protein
MSQLRSLFYETVMTLLLWYSCDVNKCDVVNWQINGSWRKRIESWPSPVASPWRLRLATPFPRRVGRGHMGRCFQVPEAWCVGAKFLSLIFLYCGDIYCWLLFHYAYLMKILKTCNYLFRSSEVLSRHFPNIPLVKPRPRWLGFDSW